MRAPKQLKMDGSDEDKQSHNTHKSTQTAKGCYSVYNMFSTSSQTVKSQGSNIRPFCRTLNRA